MGMFSRIAAVLLVVSVTVSYGADFTQLRQSTKLVIHTQLDLTKPGVAYRSGSGVVLAPGYVLTARHVVEEADHKTYVGDNLKSRQDATVVKISDQLTDLALLYVPGTQCPCIRVAEENPSIDTEIIHVGFPLYSISLTQFLNHGAVQGYAGKDQYQMITNVNIAPGSSGGAFYTLTINGWRLAGTSVSVFHQPVIAYERPQLITWMSIGVSASKIREFLKGTPAEQ